MGVYGTFEIEITDFREDPPNDSAFEVIFDVRGPLNRYEMRLVYFTEDFLVRYFRIRWFKRLPQEEKKLLREKRPLFVRWAIMKLEEAIKKDSPDEKIGVDYESDAAWAEKVEKGILKPSSEAQSDTLFILKL